MSRSSEQNIINQLRQVLKDSIDYLYSVLALLQARMAEFALSGVVFTSLIAMAFLLGLASFILLNIALGVWLSHITGNPGWSILILGTSYAGLAALSIQRAFRWLKKLQS